MHYTKEEVYSLDPTGQFRCNMWNRLLNDWTNFKDYCYADRRTQKKAWLEAHGYDGSGHTLCAQNNLLEQDMICTDGCVPAMAWKKINSLAYIPDPAPVKCEQPRQEKENNMGYEVNIEVDQRNHLKRRLENAQVNQDLKARKTYHMNGIEVEGKTKDEVLALLTSSIKLCDNAFNSSGKVRDYHDVYSVFSFQDAARDEAGYMKAAEAIRTAYTAAKDTILVLPLPEGLKALQDFEAKTF